MQERKNERKQQTRKKPGRHVQERCRPQTHEEELTHDNHKGCGCEQSFNRDRDTSKRAFSMKVSGKEIIEKGEGEEGRRRRRPLI